MATATATAVAIAAGGVAAAMAVVAEGAAGERAEEAWAAVTMAEAGDGSESRQERLEGTKVVARAVDVAAVTAGPQAGDEVGRRAVEGTKVVARAAERTVEALRAVARAGLLVQA